MAESFFETNYYYGRVKGFGFNGSVLMDAESYTVNPAQPKLTPASSTPLTAGVDELQMEFGI